MSGPIERLAEMQQRAEEARAILRHIRVEAIEVGPVGKSQADVEPLLRAVETVLEAHKPEHNWDESALVCSECWGPWAPLGPGSDDMPYPCPTVRDITEQLEI